jgi:hypothetical protein
MALRTDAGHTPSKSASRSMDGDDKSPRFRPVPIGAVNEDYDDDYLNEDDFEDDFEAFEGSAGSKSVDNKLPQSPIVVPDDGDDDGLDDALLDEGLDEADGEGEEQEDEANNVEGMTLESYMQEYAKKAAVKYLDDDVVNGDTVEASPEAVDPQVGRTFFYPLGAIIPSTVLIAVLL